MIWENEIRIWAAYYQVWYNALQASIVIAILGGICQQRDCFDLQDSTFNNIQPIFQNTTNNFQKSESVTADSSRATVTC